MVVYQSALVVVNHVGSDAPILVGGGAIIAVVAHQSAGGGSPLVNH